LSADSASGLVRERQVQRQELRRRVHVLHVLDLLDAELAEALWRDERVVCNDAHAQPGGAARDLLADPAEAEHAEGLVRELDAAVLLAVPPAFLQRRMSLRDVARQRREQADRVL